MREIIADVAACAHIRSVTSVKTPARRECEECGKITAPIGAGGMGEVYKARDTRLRREVAIKVLLTN